jgi:hypothetical protein
MSNATGPDPADLARVVTNELLARGEQLKPGSAEYLGKAWGPTLGGMPADARAAELERRISSEPYVKAHLNPAYQPAGSDLERALGRLGAGRLKPGSVEALARELAPQDLHRSPVETARFVAKFLDSPAASQHLNADHQRPASPAHQRVAEVVRGEFPISDAGLAALLADRKDLARMDDRQIVRSVAQALRSPVMAARWGAPHIGPGDFRLAEQPAPRRTIDGKAAGPNRHPNSGQFTPSRKRNTSF